MGRVPEDVRRFVLERDNYTCQWCGRRVGWDWEEQVELVGMYGGKPNWYYGVAHHIVGQSEGGSDDPENLLTVCAKCHWGLH